MRITGLNTYKLKKAIYEQDDELNDILVGYEEVGTIQANMQPLQGYSKVQQYGQEITKYLGVVMYPNVLVEEGLYIEYDKKHYQIQPIQKWKHWEFDIKVVV